MRPATDILPSLEREFGRTIYVRRVSATTYNYTTGDKTQSHVDLEIKLCLVKRYKEKLVQVPQANGNRVRQQVYIRKSKLSQAYRLATGTTGDISLTQADIILIDNVEHFIDELDTVDSSVYSCVVRDAR